MLRVHFSFKTQNAFLTILGHINHLDHIYTYKLYIFTWYLYTLLHVILYIHVFLFKTLKKKRWEKSEQPKTRASESSVTWQLIQA